MHSIILAAGEGTRLRQLTNKIPKCMINLFGKSLIERQIDTYRECNIENISVVTGYMRDTINFPNVKYYHNEKYDTTNMVESLFCAKKELYDSTIISYGDIIFEKNVLSKLLNSNHEISIVVDLNWKKYWELRFDDPLDDAESMIFSDDNYIESIGQKVDNLKEIQGQYIGLMKFQNDGIKWLTDCYQQIKNSFYSKNNKIKSTTNFEKFFMTDLLQVIINSGHKIKAIPISSGWLELDTIDDYELYQKKYDEHTLIELISLND